MANKRHEGELSEQQLDGIAGGQQQQVVKMGTIVVEGKRIKPEPKPQVVKMETIVVTAQREKPDLAGTKIAQNEARNKKD
jgi:hypothetical protein